MRPITFIPLQRGAKYFAPRTAFTLVEILIVLSIIGVLVAILLPVVSGVRQSAQTTTCAGNLKQIGLALRLYVQDSRGFYPYAYAPTVGATQCSWSHRLESYIRSPDIWECPASWDGEYRAGCPADDNFAIPPVSFCGDYDMNFLESWMPHEVRFRHPTDTILALDGDAQNHCIVNPAREPLTTPRDLLERGVPDPRHGTGHNVLFADSHVKWKSLESLTDRSLWLLSKPRP